jgi:hypothetical protein
VSGEALTEEAAAPEAASDSDTGGATISTPVVSVTDRSIVYTVDLVVRVDDVEAAAVQAAEVADRFGGYVQSESTYGSGVPLPVEPQPYDTTKIIPPVDQGQAVVVLRVPVDRYTDAVAELEALGQTVSRARSSDDVTEQVVDVESRIETQRAAIDRLQQLLATATTVSDVLAVESQLTTRVAELESLEARQEQLATLTSLATVTSTFVPPQTVVDEGTGFLAGLRAGWRAFLRSIQLGLTALGALLPFAAFAALLLVPLVTWLGVRTRRRRRERVEAAAAVDATTGAAEEPVPAAAAPSPSATSAPPPPTGQG